MSTRASGRSWRAIDWPVAFALVFGAMPTLVIVLAALCTYPAVLLPVLGIGCAAWAYRATEFRRAAFSERAAAEYPLAAALVAQPLPDLPTLPLRRKALR